MKTIILAAGQGTRLRPLTDHCPKCMVEVNGISIIERQLAVMRECGIVESDITIICGYKNDVLRGRLKDTKINFIINREYETTNMVCSLMCAHELMESCDDLLISYGDIIYSKTVLEKILAAEKDTGSVIVDDGWYEYWAERNENPLDDAETLMFDRDDFLTEIGQKTDDLSKIQSQYIGLMRFREAGLKEMLALAAEAQKRSSEGRRLWRTDRNYNKMYMTDLLMGLIDTGSRLRAVHINRGWFEIDDPEDLKVVETKLE